MQIDHKNQQYLFSQSDTKEERKQREHVDMKVYTDIDEGMKGINNKTTKHSDNEKSVIWTLNKDNQKIKKHITNYTIKRLKRSRMKRKRH